MKATRISLLGYTLLGLLRHQQRSGYDLRKIFAQTPLTRFSDSPGSIYPALRRLAERRLIQSKIRDSSGLRRRKVFRLTSAGVAALKGWLSQPVTREDVVRGTNELMLRFAFTGETLGSVAALRFLKTFQKELASYLPALSHYLQLQEDSLTLSGRLALESGIIGYEALIEWTRRAIAAYEKRTKRGRS